MQLVVKIIIKPTSICWISNYFVCLTNCNRKWFKSWILHLAFVWKSDNEVLSRKRVYLRFFRRGESEHAYGFDFSDISDTSKLTL